LSKTFIGIDIGASKLRVCLVDEEGNVLWSRVSPIGPTPSVQSITSLLDSMLKGIELKLTSAGVGVAGFVSTPNGEVLEMPNAGIGYFPVADIFSGILKKRPIVMNDAVAAVYGESVANGYYKDMLYLTMSTGIGGAAILNGRVVSGREGNSHEVGHIVVDHRLKLRCGCGGLGHWEAYCSGRGIPKFAQLFVEDLGEECTKAFKSCAESGGASDIFELVKKGDRSAKRFLDELIHINAVGLASVINVYAPTLIVVGGGVGMSRWGEYILPSFRSTKRMLVSALPRIQRSKLDELSTAYGAAMLAMDPAPLDLN
jgi:glucokinase